MKWVAWLAAAAAVGILAACGGNVVVDPDSGGGGDGGAPTTTTTTTTTTGGNGGAGASCAVPPPIGPLQFCGGSATVGSGEPSQCITTACDAQGNQYESQCTSTSCACLFNFKTICSCALQGEGDMCAGTTPKCCPAPFPQQ